MLEKFIARLRDKKLELQENGLLAPNRDGDVSFNYGFLCGKVTALVEVEDLLKTLVDEEKVEGDLQ